MANQGAVSNNYQMDSLLIRGENIDNNTDDLPEDTAAVLSEVRLMKERKIESLQNVVDYKEKLQKEEELWKKIQNEKELEYQMLVNISHQLSDYKYKNKVLQTNTQQIRETLEETNIYCLEIDQSLKVTEQDLENLQEQRKTLKVTVDATVSGLESKLCNIIRQRQELHQQLVDEKNTNKKDIEKWEAKCHNLKKEVDVNNSSLKSFHEEYDLLTENTKLETMLESETKIYDNLTVKKLEQQNIFTNFKKEMENKKRGYEELLDATNSGTVSVKDRKKKTEEDLCQLEQVITEKINFNIEKSEIINNKQEEKKHLEDQTANRIVEQKNQLANISESQLLLTKKLDEKLEEYNIGEVALKEHNLTFDNVKKEFEEKQKTHQLLLIEIPDKEQLLQTTKHKLKLSIQTVNDKTGAVVSIKDKLNALQCEVEEWKTKCNNLKIISENKTLLLNSELDKVVAEIEERKTETDIKVKSLNSDLNEAMAKFNHSLEELTEEFNRKQDHVKLALEEAKKELTNLSNFIMEDDSQLRQFAEEQNIRKPATHFKTPNTRATFTSSALPLTSRSRDYDESSGMSGSSLEGNVYTHKQIVPLMERKKKKQLQKINAPKH